MVRPVVVSVVEGVVGAGCSMAGFAGTEVAVAYTAAVLVLVDYLLESLDSYCKDLEQAVGLMVVDPFVNCPRVYISIRVI